MIQSTGKAHVRPVPPQVVYFAVFLAGCLTGCLLFSCTMLATQEAGPHPRDHAAPTAISLQSSLVEGLIQSDFRSATTSFIVTDAIFRLMPEDAVKTSEEQIKSNCPSCMPSSHPVEYRRWVISESVRLKLPGAKIFLLDSPEPPSNVHAMSRGAGYTAGGLYTADLMIQGLPESRRAKFKPGTFLDFGGSSGRLARVLKAAWPESEAYLCDPNKETISWLSANNPSIHATLSSHNPPLDFKDNMFDSIFAVSIWSHYAELAAVRWLNEMARILKPGGLFIFSTHGWESIRYYSNNLQMNSDHLDQVTRDMYSRGFHFWDSFGPQGDWGVVNPDSEWGHSFLSKRWLARHMGTKWLMLSHTVGLNSNNQDVFVLQKV